MPAGRPTDYDADIHVPLVATTIPDGATLTQIAVACGQALQTVRLWMKEHPEFMAAVMRARDAANSPVICKSYRSALAGDQKAIDRWLHNRCPDEFPGQQRVEVSGPDGGPITHADVTDRSDAELIAEARALAERAQAARSADDGAETQGVPESAG